MATILATGDKLLAILGLSKLEYVSKVVLTIEPDSIPTVEVTRCIMLNEAYEDVEELFYLMEAPQETSVE